MATHHAEPGKVVDLETWASDLPDEKTKVIIKTNELELVRLVIPAGKVIPRHKVSGPVVIHCLYGEIFVNVKGKSTDITTGQLIYLNPGEPHSLRSVSESIVLLSIIFK